MEKEGIYTLAWETWGTSSQIDVFIEEMLELVHELLKARRGAAAAPIRSTTTGAGNGIGTVGSIRRPASGAATSRCSGSGATACGNISPRRRGSNDLRN